MRLSLLLSGFLSVAAIIGWLGLEARPAAAEGSAAELVGAVPASGVALLRLGSDATPGEVDGALEAVGCDASWIGVAVGGQLLKYRPEGESDAGFPTELSAELAILVLCAPATSGLDLANGSYDLGGLIIELEDGESAFPAAPGSASMVTTSLTGWQAAGDLDGDEVADAAGVVVHSTGGTGNFRYLITQLTDGGAVPGALLGDRIAMEGIAVRDGIIEVDYLDRPFGDPFTAPPTVPTSRGFTVSADEFVEVPAGQWHLVAIDGAALVEGTAIDARFSAGTVSGSAGCNQYSGGYEIRAPSLTVGPPIAVTAKACETSILNQEQSYLVALEGAQTFSISEDSLVIETSTAELRFQRANVEPAGAWTLETLAGTTVLAGTSISASFDGSTIAGSAGCNEYSGSYEVDALALTLSSPVAVTLRACEPAIANQELAYLEALEAAQRFSITGDTLTIETGAGELVFTRSS